MNLLYHTGHFFKNCPPLLSVGDKEQDSPQGPLATFGMDGAHPIPAALRAEEK